jgi:phosphodiesterase/alkaline phosphatase D-like protein
MHAWQHYLGSVNAPSEDHYNTFARGDTAFFVMDVRSHRSGTHLGIRHPDRSMLGAKQLQYLMNWLKAVQRHGYVFKILVSPVPFTFNWYEADSWYGYQHERQLILDFIATNKIENVVVLSGDRHQVAVVEMEMKNQTQPVVEFSVSPINQFSMPIPWFKETENEHFPNSSWTRDKKVFYSHATDLVQIGRLHVDTKTLVPKLVFCLFGEHPATTKSEQDKDGECGGGLKEQPVFKYVMQGRRPEKKMDVKEKKKSAVVDWIRSFF